MIDFHIQTQFQYFKIKNFQDIVSSQWLFIPSSKPSTFLFSLHFALSYDKNDSSLISYPYLNIYLPNDAQFIDDFLNYDEDVFLGYLKLKLLGPAKKSFKDNFKIRRKSC